MDNEALFQKLSDAVVDMDEDAAVTYSKNLVRIMLESSGFDILDLGRDVPLQTLQCEPKIKWEKFPHVKDAVFEAKDAIGKNFEEIGKKRTEKSV
jgi:methanogenic corrinoid protein MtbC1